ncbi:zinc finger domain-containing protein [Arthrobacter sp. Leaf69]|uniref:zinc finger domain-containing protein n=1 Tax=Arthrobacter sp. Leaf69 TaxID=1736232 RepID=UPI0006FC8E7B|nr:hypothetical protein [Arthrobacter sp. Leaf69]KQN88985.1 hypothetical protein ASE96_04995 [Arthrobacter sp. Leaf69]
MNKIQSADDQLSQLNRAVEMYQKKRLSRRALLDILKWDMAVTEESTVSTFLDGVRGNQTLTDDLIDEITRLYTENVQHWAFPEEGGLAKALPEAVEGTFPELIQSLKSARGALSNVLDKIVGVNVRLNLRSSYGAVVDARRLMSSEIALLERACEHVGAGTLLAPEFPGEDDLGQPSWSSPGGAPLSPKQIVWLADLGQKRPELTVNYAEGISAHSSPPQLVTERIEAREWERIRAEENRRLEERMRKGMARSCPRCESAPGAACRSRAGTETTMHKGRYIVLARTSQSIRRG